MDRNIKMCILWCLIIIVLVAGAWFLMTQRMSGHGLPKQMTPSSSGS